MKNDASMVRKYGWPLLALIVLALLVVGCTPTSASLAGATQVSPLEQEAFIKVVGFGKALGQPDEAQVTLGVETFAPAVNDATGENEATIEAILRALDESGIQDEDIQTSNYSLWAEQKYGDNGPEGIAGYRVVNQVIVVIRDIDKVGDVLSAATAAGSNSIYGVQFFVADAALLEAEAREKALENAQQRAESLAGLSDLTLGDILAIDESMGQYPEYGRGGGGGFGGGAMESAASISPGQLTYLSQVQVTYAILK